MVKIMAIKDILDQEVVKKILQGALKEKRIAHSYLFTGPAGTGKWLTAVELAKAVNCLKEGFDSCGECSACKKISRLVHPDLSLIFPLPPPSSGKKSKKEKEEEEQKNRTKFVEEKLANPYRIVRYEKPGSISIEEVRNVQKNLLYTPVEGRYKVLIVQEPEKMSLAAENCFLKTLEEPPGDSLLIFLSSEPEKLLPTIVSRCQRIRFKRIPEELIARRLEEVFRLSKEKALHYARLSEGSLGTAFSLTEGNKEEIRLNGMEFLKLVYNKDRIKLVEFIEQILKDYERESILELLNFLSGLLRDIYVFSETQKEEKFLNPDLRKEIKAFVQYFKDREELEETLELVEKIREDLLRNVNLKLALLNLGFELRKTTSGLRRDKLVT
jgi:DNA polymerase-3 subunit delta'